MTILNEAKDRVALFLGGSIAEYPQMMMIGTGSALTTSGMSALVTALDRQALTSTTNTTRKVQWVADWNVLEVSGNQITEFGMCLSGTGLTGSMWSRTGFPAITFDGTNELRIQETWEVF
jgi:hypothetical protein